MYHSGDSAELFSLRPDTPEETRIYGCARRLTALPADQAIDQFYKFFFQALNPSTPEAREALLEIATVPESEKVFHYILNRCFYTLCNPWRTDVSYHGAIRELVLQLEKLPKKRVNDPQVRQLQQLVLGFVGTPQHIALKRQMQVLFADDGDTVVPPEGDRYLGEDLRRYFYLHETTMTTKDVAQDQRETIIQLQRQTRYQFEQQCRQFVASCKSPQGRLVPNPSQLEEDEFFLAFDHYRPERSNSYSQQASEFTQQRQKLQTMADFQGEFTAYLLETLSYENPRYQNNLFGRRLRQHLERAADGDMPINQTMIVQVCRRTLEFLVIENLKRPNTVNFRNLLKDVGHTITVGVLLKVVMFCKAVRPWFEERFGILFHLYEQTRKGEIPWLVQSLEHLNIALALNHKEIAAYC
ncbi:MAG: hypothetical protein AAFW84_06755 [Cyanobacteria bacterium J06635_15]